MNRVAPWVLVLAGLAWAGCFPATVGVTVPVGPAYEESPPPPPPPPTQALMEAQVYVSNQPPPLQAEYPPPAPGPGYAWISGYWDWTGYEWNWIGGYWTPSRPGYFYVAPRYVVIGGRPVYERGYWHDHQGRRDYQYARPAPMYRESPPPGHPGMHGGPAPARAAAGSAAALPPMHSQPAPNPGWHGNPGGSAGSAAALPPAHTQGAPTPAASPPGQAGMLRSRGPTAGPAPGPGQMRSAPPAGAAPRPAAPAPARRGNDKKK